MKKLTATQILSAKLRGCPETFTDAQLREAYQSTRYNTDIRALCRKEARRRGYNAVVETSTMYWRRLLG